MQHELNGAVPKLNKNRVLSDLRNLVDFLEHRNRPLTDRVFAEAGLDTGMIRSRRIHSSDGWLIPLIGEIALEEGLISPEEFDTFFSALHR